MSSLLLPPPPLAPCVYMVWETMHGAYLSSPTEAAGFPSAAPWCALGETGREDGREGAGLGCLETGLGKPPAAAPPLGLLGAELVRLPCFGLFSEPNATLLLRAAAARRSSTTCLLLKYAHWH